MSTTSPKPTRPRRAIVIALGILALLHLYVGLRLIPPLPGSTWVAAIAAAVLLASFVLTPVAMSGRHSQADRGARIAVWVGLVLMGLFSSLFVLTLLREPLLLMAWAIPLDARFTSLSALGVIVLSVAATAIGWFGARRLAGIVDVDIPLKDLPEGLEGFTIAQISDVHVGPTIRRDQLDGIVDAVNALQADVIAVTGDLVDGSVSQLVEHTAPLSRLRARHGAFFVTGNHEYYSGAQAWVDEVQRLGLRVLTNEHVVLRHDGEQVVLAGVTDYSAHQFDPAHRSDPQRALAGAPTERAPRILLAHQPRSAPAAEKAGFDLQLSGHTHGGQFWPWNHFVRFQQPFTAGLHRVKSLWVYTSRGTGYWGPPKRLGAPSEITRIRLVRA